MSVKLKNVVLKTVEMHTGGDPVRIVVSGLPDIEGATLLQKRQFARENLDSYRKLLVQEPRGHHDMYGVYLVPPDDPAADIACVFIAAHGYGTMCGHALMSIGVYAVDKGLVKTRTSPETQVVVQCPGGTARIFVEYSNGVTGRSRINSVPAFVHSQGVGVDVPGFGRLTVDVSYGGVFYAILPASQLRLKLGETPIHDLIKAALAVTESVRNAVKLHHPENAELAVLCGTILTDGADDASEVHSGFCVYGDRQVPRAPCGTGVTARVALMYAKGLLPLGQTRTFSGPSGSEYTAAAIRQVKYGCHDNAVVVEVIGKACYTGKSSFILEEGDILGQGFLLG